MSRDFRSALLDYEKQTQGKTQAKSRWLSCVEDLNDYYHGFTFALGYIWVTKAFDTGIIPFVSKRYTMLLFLNRRSSRVVNMDNSSQNLSSACFRHF